MCLYKGFLDQLKLTLYVFFFNFWKYFFKQPINFYYCTESSCQLFPQAFEIMEQVKVELGVEKYTLTQTSLEQVFLNLTKCKSKTEERNEVDEYLVWFTKYLMFLYPLSIFKSSSDSFFWFLQLFDF